VKARGEHISLEDRVRADVLAGKEVDCAPPDTTTPDDLDAIDDWDQRTITADLLVELCTGEGAAHPRAGVHLKGACVIGTVDLARADVLVPMRFELCRFDAGINLAQAHIRSLRARGCVIATLYAAELESDRSLYLAGSHLNDVVLLDGRIHGGVDLTRATLSKENGTAFGGDRLSVTGAVDFRLATVTGELRLCDAQVGGGLSLTGATLSNKNGTAFIGDGLSVTGTVFFEQATVTGLLRLRSAQIVGDLSLSDATLSNENGTAFGGDGLSVTGAVFFEQATVTGEVRLRSAGVGNLSLTGATLSNENGTAFVGDGLSVTGIVFLDKATVTGELRLSGAQVGEQVSLNGATLSNKDARTFTAEAMRVAMLMLRRCAIHGEVDLAGAAVDHLIDDLSSWPDQVIIDGFSYGSLTGARDVDVASRLKWIRRNHDYSPGLYDQLADVYRRAGQDQNARAVAIAREDDRRRRGQLGVFSRGWNRFLSITVAHGYQPWRAALFLIAVLAVSTWLFLLPAADDAMVPTSNMDPVPTADDCTPRYECFEPWLYSLDVILPVVDLHQESNWLPSADRPWGDWYRLLVWTLIAIGWLLTTALIAAIGTVWRR
jgi:hypothetical protein